jgi:hypothetical protein
VVFARRGTAAALALLAMVAACRRSKLPPRPDGAAVVVAPEATGEVQVARVPEVEPNDLPAKAHRLLVTIGSPAGVEGTLATDGKKPDVDVFRIDIPFPDGGVQDAAPAAAGPDAAVPPFRPRASLRCDLQSKEGAPAFKLEVLDEAGRVSVSAMGTEPGQVIAIPNLAVWSAAPYLRVRRAKADATPAAYTLIVRAAPVEAGAEIEPNGTVALATELGPNAEAIGYLGWTRDQDFYRLPTAGLAEGSVLSVDVDPIPGVGATLAVTDPAGQKLSEARSNRAERVALRNVGVPVGATHLYLSVLAQAGWNADARYSVRVRSELPKPGAEAEPNNDPGHAQAVADGTTQGNLARGDVDVFRYAVTAPVVLDVELAPPERATVKLELQDEGGKSLGRGEAKRRPLRIANVAVAGGTILIRVAAGRGEGNPDEPYRLTISSRPGGEVPGAGGAPEPEAP